MWFAVFLVASVWCWQTTVQTEPKVTTTIPPYGPRIGGTRVFIQGEKLSGITEVWLVFDKFNMDVPLTVNLTASRDNIIDCKTPEVDEVLIGHSGYFLLVFNDSNFEDNITTMQTFIFKPDPVILEIAPGSSIVRGGIQQTISGEYLDSVFLLAEMNVTLIYQHRDHYQQQDYTNERLAGICQIQNATTMFCNSKPVSNSPIHPLPTWNPLRQAEYYFRVGFKMDGYTAYNFTEVIYWQDPLIQKFDKVMPFKVYKGQDTIEIKGNGFMNGVIEDDYSILIGNGSTLDGQSANCVIVGFYANLIRCKPPPEPPHLGDVHSDGSPRVTLQIGYIKEQVGYIRYELKPWDDPVVRTIVISVVCVAAALIIIISIVVPFVKHGSTQPPGRQPNDNSYVRSPDFWSRIPPNLKAALEPCIKSHDRLRLGSALGEGQFGQVHAAKFFTDSGAPILVAAKTIKENNVSRQELREFLEEATMMKDFNHPNVLHLVGVVVKQGRPFVLLPYMENGDLRSHLLNANNMFTVENLLQYVLQIAKGMEYITSRNYVHRDLAARNCMVSLDDNVKVADFGLAREVHTDDYYRIGDNIRPLPIKWMAIESLEDKKFTKYSDVWSFGVTFWEVMTRGKRPYADVDNFSIRQYLRRGKRLDKPDALPEELYMLMLRCWEFQPLERPSFTTIKSELESALEVDANDYVSADNNEPDVALDRQYQNLSRYVDHTTDRHGYVAMLGNPVIEPGDCHTTGIDYRGARAAFDAIDEGYLSPVNLNGGVDANGNAKEHTASTTDTAVHVEGNTAYYNHGYDNIDSVERQARQNLGIDDINIIYPPADSP